MRLSDHAIAAIKAATRLTFGEGATVRLFGSRTDDARKGGDIDLHVEVETPVEIWAAKARFEERLFARIDRQRVDLLVSQRGKPVSAIERIAYRDGIVL